jgi:hypothetical protein
MQGTGEMLVRSLMAEQHKTNKLYIQNDHKTENMQIKYSAEILLRGAPL